MDCNPSHNILTIDFEDWYQGLTSTSGRPQQWPDFESRVTVGGSWLLDALAAHDARATFFVVGEVAREHPVLVRRIVEDGHEIALHGDLHQRVDSMTREQFRADLSRNIEAVVQAGGQRPVAYRAPCFSLGKHTEWIWDELCEQGVRIDSSVFPIRNPLYGLPEAPRQPFRRATNAGYVQEYPVTTWRMLGTNWPFSGGFYFRVLPYTFVRRLTRSLNRRGEMVIFYFHPWELDPGHPCPASVTARERLSHYGWLRGARAKLLRLLNDFRFEPLGRTTA